MNKDRVNLDIPKAIPTDRDINYYKKLVSMKGSMVTVNIRNDITISSEKEIATISSIDEMIHGKIVHVAMICHLSSVNHYLYIMALPTEKTDVYVKHIPGEDGTDVYYTHVVKCNANNIKVTKRKDKGTIENSKEKSKVSIFTSSNPDIKNKINSQKRVVAAFPGMGKSTAAKLHPELFIDMESSEYHWMEDLSGRYKNPEWPYNYVDAIFEEAYRRKPGEPKYILISTHEEVLREISRLGYNFDVMIPSTAEYVKSLYERRGSSPEFIKSVIDNFDKYIDDVKNSDAEHIYVGDCYLSEVLA